MHSSSVCPHLFAGKRPERPHYCSYIQVQRLLDTFPGHLTNTEERLFYSFCSSSVLWLRLQWRDLVAVRDSLAALPVQSDHLQLGKRLRRCGAIANILSHQAQLTAAILQSSERPRLRLVPGGALPLLAETMHCLHAISQLLAARTAWPATRREELRLEFLTLECAQHQFESVVLYLLQSLVAESASLRLSDMLNIEALFEPAELTLRRHHPQALRPGSSNDELLFITSHQVFELWFPSVLTRLDEAIAELLGEQPDLARVELRVRQVLAIYRLFCEMIQMPQQMSAADYLAFRSQLEGGSGLESVGFRALEITIGQRDPVLLRNLLHMQLATDDLAARLARPSLSDAYLIQLRHAGIIQDIHDHDQIALRLAALMRPTAAPNPHGALLGLGETLVGLEQELENWRRHHLSMVDRMIGYRLSLGVAGNDPLPLEAQACPAHAGKKDGRPYLQQTLTYKRVFSYLWEARSKIREEDVRRWLSAAANVPPPLQAARRATVKS